MPTLYPVLTDNSTRLITGDPQAALNLKANLASPTFTGVPLSTTAAGGTNTTQIATTAFVSAAVSLAVTGLLELKGSLDCSTNPNYPAGSVGDAYLVTVAGLIGGASGLAVDIGDTIICQTDNAGGTQAAVGASWFVLEHNLAGALLSANNLSDVASNATARTNLGLGTLATQSGTFSGTSSGTNTGDQTAVTGNAGTATALQTARAINGVSFDGTAPITVEAAAGTLTGATLASNVLASSLTSVGTLAAVAITGGAINGATLGATTPATGAFTSLSATGITTVASGTALLPSIVSTTGTADTGLWFPAADTLAASTAGSERIRISSTGNVGIGNSSPLFKFTVGTGTINGVNALHNVVVTDATDARIGVYVNNIGASLRSEGTYASLFAYDYTNNIGKTLVLCEYGGNVGIGTTSPGAQLQVSSGAAGTIGSIIKGAASQTANLTEWQNSSATVLACVTAAGNVGIGMTSPIAKLQIAGTGTAVMQLGSSATVADNWHITAETAGVGTRDFTIWNGNYLGGSQRLTILNGGATGIGTSAPLSKLGVAGSASVGATYGAIAAPASGMIIEGNVGIGTSTPNANALLDVSSTTQAFMPPRMTTTQKNAIASPTAGMLVYDSTLGKLSIRVASAWQTVTSA